MISLGSEANSCDAGAGQGRAKDLTTSEAARHSYELKVAFSETTKSKGGGNKIRLHSNVKQTIEQAS